MNQFINLVNEALDYNDPIQSINKIVGNSLFDKIIDENYINQFKSVNQKGSRCWAWALSAVIYLASTRIFGRKIKKFKKILKQILTDENAYNDIEEKKQGRPFLKWLKNILKFIN